MKNKMFKLIALFLILSIAFSFGCSKEFAPVYTVGVNEAGETIVSTGGMIKEASISKESIVNTTKQVQFMQYVKAHKESGLKMEFEAVELAPGFKAYLPKKIEFREAPNFAQLGLPATEPSKHPVWNTINYLFEKGLWAFLGWQFFDFLKGAQQGARYYGDYSPYNQNPVNSGEGSMTFTPGMLNQGGYQPFEAPVVVTP